MFQFVRNHTNKWHVFALRITRNRHVIAQRTASNVALLDSAVHDIQWPSPGSRVAEKRVENHKNLPKTNISM